MKHLFTFNQFIANYDISSSQESIYVNLKKVEWNGKYAERHESETESNRLIESEKERWLKEELAWVKTFV
jgi:hypothetical protein